MDDSLFISRIKHSRPAAIPAPTQSCHDSLGPSRVDQKGHSMGWIRTFFRQHLRTSCVVGGEVNGSHRGANQSLDVSAEVRRAGRPVIQSGCRTPERHEPTPREWNSTTLSSCRSSVRPHIGQCTSSCRSASHRSFGRTACTSVKATETTDGPSSETEKPSTARLATSIASVNQGRPIGSPLNPFHWHCR